LINNPTQLKSALNVSNTSSATVNEYAAGFILLRYFAEQSALSYITESTADLDGNTIGGTGEITLDSAGSYTIAEGFTGTIIINTTNTVTLTSSAKLNDVTVRVAASKASLIINDLDITNTADNVIDFASSGGTLTVNGTANLTTSAANSAAVNIGSTSLTVSGSGTLNATSSGNGAAIGTDAAQTSTGTLTISGGTVNATSSGNGAAIGSGAEGSLSAINISGGTVTAKVSSGFGAAVGSGYQGSVTSITINGDSDVTADSYQGAAVGSGVSAQAGDIAINGNAQVSATSNRYGAGIGSGYGSSDSAASSVGNITVSGDVTVTATSQNDGVGIGLGAGSSSAGNISISANTDTSSTSAVVINNSAVSTVTVNDVDYYGASQLTFVDGSWSSQSDTQSVTINKGGSYALNDSSFTGVIYINTSDNVTILSVSDNSFSNLSVQAVTDNVNLTLQDLTFSNSVSSPVILGSSYLQIIVINGTIRSQFNDFNEPIGGARLQYNIQRAQIIENCLLPCLYR